MAVGRPYDVHIGEGILFAPESGGLIRRACGGGRRCAIISDSHVAPLYSARLKESLEAAGCEVGEVVFPAGETSKSLSEVSRLCGCLIDAGLDRQSFLVALGGGVTGDLAGFVAAVFYRGIPYAQVPTSLLAMVDSSVGGKTGVNASAGKNLIGAFHQPSIVVADTHTLGSLPPRVLNEGLAEIIKHGVIRDAALVSAAVDLLQTDPVGLVSRNVAIKARVVEADEKETGGLRALLNFGHTVGHALEQTCGYGSLLHGEAIGLGMLAALRLSERIAGLADAEAALVVEALDSASLPLAPPHPVDPDLLLAAMKRDKKFSDGRIRFVLTRQLGSAFISDEVRESDIRSAISDWTDQ